MIALLKKFTANQGGATAIEYALIAGLAAARPSGLAIVEISTASPNVVLIAL